MQQSDMNQILQNSEEIKCSNCGATEFVQVFKLRRVSALFSPTQQEMLLPLPIYECNNCGQLMDK